MHNGRDLFLKHKTSWINDSCGYVSSSLQSGHYPPYQSCFSLLRPRCYWLGRSPWTAGRRWESCCCFRPTYGPCWGSPLQHICLLVCLRCISGPVRGSGPETRTAPTAAGGIHQASCCNHLGWPPPQGRPYQTTSSTVSHYDSPTEHGTVADWILQ